MKTQASLISLILGAGVGWFLVATPVVAQETTLENLVNESQAAIKRESWEQAVEINSRAITLFGNKEPRRKYGSQFGVIYYRKGFCEIKLKRWKDAMRSFEICYRDFPNVGADQGNTYQKMALRKWAESAMGAEEWQLAISQFAKFNMERDKIRDVFPQGSYYLNVAVCHYKLGHIAEGSENLEIAIRNKANFPTSDVGIITGFQALVSAVIVSGNEQALLDFIGKNRSSLLIGPSGLLQFSPVFMKLAGDAIGCGMRRAAMELYQLVPSTDEAIDDVRARLKAMGTAEEIVDGRMKYSRKRLEEDLATFEADRRGKRATESIKLAAVAYVHEASGNFLGAFAAYQQLELDYPGSEKREENLFNLIRVASRVGLDSDLRVYAEIYLRDFPDSERIPEVRHLILSTDLAASDAGKRIEIAGPMLEKLESGSLEHDRCLYLLGAAYFDSGMDEKALELLGVHARIYPKSGYAADVAYDRAVASARLRNWEKAAALFGEFIEAYPDRPELPFALHERATCHLELGEREAALQDIQHLTRDFPESPVNAEALNLLGNIRLALGDSGEAEKSYLKAYRIAADREDRRVAGESLCLLVEVLGRNEPASEGKERTKEAVAHADQFWKNYAEGSPYQARMAVAQVSAFTKVDRGDEALERLKEFAAKGAEASVGSDTLINAYAEAYLGSHTANELAREFENFPGADLTNKSLLARLKMLVIGAYEKESALSPDEMRKQAAAARVKTIYQKLKTEFAPADLDVRTLIRLADHIRENTSTPREALPYYDEAISRNDRTTKMAALIGQGDVGTRSKVPAEIEAGIGDFQKVYTESRNKVERGYALFRIVEAWMAKGDFTTAADEASRYLDRADAANLEFAPQVRLMFARSLQELKQTEKAIDEYAKIWSADGANLKMSAPAMIGWMQLLWNRNREPADGASVSDRQTAYEGGARYLERTVALSAALPEDELGPWREIQQSVKTFATSPGIKPVVSEKTNSKKAIQK